MHSKVGFGFASVPKNFREMLHQQMAAITLYHKMSNDKFKIHDNYRREAYRVPHTSDLPPHLQVKVYVQGEDGFYHGCNLMDLSAGGFCAVMPFADACRLFKRGTTHKFIFEFARETYECEASTAHSCGVDLSGKAKQCIQKLGKIKAPTRKGVEAYSNA